ncbi:MAG TPA: FAD-dependent oxidoreductase [Thermoanaerobaculia bacterium]|nr:FAD-dependent oxidoreductase [Thermoanaerobaculia bacterium]
MDIAVIGCGVSGLSCAVRLLEERHKVTIIARELPAGTTSSVAAALWYPYHAFPLERVIAWSLESLERYRGLMRRPGSGVVPVDLFELFRGEPPEPEWRDALERFRRLDQQELPAGFESGFAVRVPLIETRLYLPWLKAWAESLGATIEQRSVASLEELDADAVVNCSGLGARELCNDSDLHPVRGQVVRLSGGAIDRATVDDAPPHATYVIPRSEDIIVGTTVEPERWDTEPDPEATEDILIRGTRLDQRISSGEILEVKVGLRPARSGVRLEVEVIGDKRVVHNYGHGGSGFTLSWGCADEVVRLIGRHS